MWRKLFGLQEERETPAGPSGKIQITPKELHQRLQQDQVPLILDVRETWEYHRAHIEGSVLIPMRDLPRQLDTLPRDAEIVVVCHHGVRSMQVLHFLSQQGFTKLRNLMGGIEAWSMTVDPKVPRY